MIPAVNGAGSNFATGVNDTGINSVNGVNSIRNSRNKINTKSFVKEQYLDGKISLAIIF